MKTRYPRTSIAIALAALLAVATAVPLAANAGATVSQSEAVESEDVMWKAEISDYDSSLSLLSMEEVALNEKEDEETTDTNLEDEDVVDDSVTQESATIASSGAVGSANTGTAVALGSPSAGQFAFTTYGYGHCVGLSQNGANYCATYGGYSYQSILFHYFPGTTLVQESTSGTVTVNGRTGSLLEMISMIVYAEMSSSMHPEAMKAQAVAAYSYIMASGGSITGAALKENPPQNVLDAVSSVLGQALYYNGSYALTVYTASTGGATANTSDIFGTNYPYLVSVPCEYDAAYDPYYGVVTYKSVDDVRARLQSAYGITLSDNPSNWISLNVGDSGYVRSVCIDGQKTVNGYSFATTLGLLSARFAYIIG